MPTSTVRDVPPEKFVVAFAAYLKKTGKITVPKWSDIVKTGTYKELAPYDVDWFYVRCASIARLCYVRGHVGIGGLTKRFGGSLNRGVRPSHIKTGSGSVARHALKALESLKILEKHEEGGRIVSKTGRRDLDRIAQKVASDLAASQQQ